MAEFQEVLRQYDRMCWFYQRKHECPMACPMNGVNKSQCHKIAFEEPEATEKIIMTWAAEHPEPIYPTWREYLTGIGVIPKVKIMPTERLESVYGDFSEAFALTNTRIDADTAQKLGIEPREG